LQKNINSFFKNKTMKVRLFLFLFILIAFISCQESENTQEGTDNTKVIEETVDTEERKIKDYKRIIVINPVLTEIVFKLGQGQKVVAYDRALPSDTTIQLPKVGYRVTLQSKYILKHKPEAVISLEEESPEKVVEEIKEEGIDYLLLPKPTNEEELKNTVNELGKILQCEDKAKILIAEIDSTIQATEKITSKVKDSVRIMYIHAPAKETVLASGSNTPIDVILSLAGAKNACDFFDDMKRLDPETMQAANPSFILISSESWEKLGGKVGANQIPALAESSAFLRGRIIIMDNYDLLEMSLNTPKVALELAIKLYGGGF